MARPVNRSPIAVAGSRTEARRLTGVRRLIVALAVAAGIAIVLPVVWSAAPRPCRPFAAGHQRPRGRAGHGREPDPDLARLQRADRAIPRSTCSTGPDGRSWPMPAPPIQPTPTRSRSISRPRSQTALISVNWRAVSATDGHDTSGFLGFGVGPVNLAGQTHSASGSGSLHPGQDTATPRPRSGQGGCLWRRDGYLRPGRAPPCSSWYRALVGSRTDRLWGRNRLARGCGWLLDPDRRRCERRRAAAGATTDYLAYATVSRSGVLLASAPRPCPARGSAGSRPDPVNQPPGSGRGRPGGGGRDRPDRRGWATSRLQQSPAGRRRHRHVGSASIWLGGLVALGGLTDFGAALGCAGRAAWADPAILGGGPRFDRPRHGNRVYAARIEIGDFSAIRSAYDLNLVVKIGVFVLAVAIGALNYLDGGRDRSLARWPVKADPAGAPAWRSRLSSSQPT